MKTVHEASQISGVSVRTLHHYDAIGLLRPTAVTEAGYRLYDDTALARLQSILLFRELAFPLKEIKRIMDDPQFDQATALEQQIRLLELQQERLSRLIDLARETMKTGVTHMDFTAFDNSKLEQYAAEVKERWGNTAAYQESAQRPAADQKDAAAGLMAQFARMGRLRTGDPAGQEAQAAVRELQQFITKHFYTCTPEILTGLGQMYTADDRFRISIDAAGGEGTADFAGKAIAAYCAKA